jgi:hypothetical protein
MTQQTEQSETPSSSIVKVKLKRGTWEVEITCAEDKVRSAVESVLAGLSATSSNEMTGTTPRIERSSNPAHSETCRGLMEKMWIEGWFGEERNLSEVHEELARRGYNYDKTAVSHSLTDLTRENVLTRVGAMRNYRYVQKRPPP